MEKVHTAPFRSGHCYPEKKLYYSGVFVSVEFTVSLYYCFLSEPNLSYQSKVGVKRR